jgi:polyisoprenoid-binding protein YceI
MATTKWISDPMHTEVQFKARHLMITTVTGYFEKFNIEVETEDEDFHKTKSIVFTADVDSISTNNQQRDTHLKSPDFFDADNHAQVRFEGKDYEELKPGFEKLNGDLTIRGTTRPITLDVEFQGIVVDPYGQTKAGFSVDGKIKRKDFGLMWDDVTEAGSIVVSDEIKVHCEIQLVKQ